MLRCWAPRRKGRRYLRPFLVLGIGVHSGPPLIPASLVYFKEAGKRIFDLYTFRVWLANGQ